MPMALSGCCRAPNCSTTSRAMIYIACDVTSTSCLSLPVFGNGDVG